MHTNFTHFILGLTEENTIRIIEKIGTHIQELKQHICIETLILEKINQEPEFTSLTFELNVKNETYIFRIHRFYLSTWFDGYIEKKDVSTSAKSPSQNEMYILSQWQNSLLNHDEFSIVYQPILNMRTGSCTNVEALIRWKHRENYISPASFIPILEENNQLSVLEYWVIKEVMKQIAKWQRININLAVHINISIKTLQEEGFFKRFYELLEAHHILPSSIILEITERSTITVTDCLKENMSNLTKIGVTFAIDDFGAGNTSFSYISKIPISMVKIDKQFITNESNNIVLDAIINSLQTLNMTIVAEGIETNEMMTQLKKKKLHFVQGYHYSKPLAARELTQFYKTNSKLAKKYKEKKVDLKIEKTINKNHFIKMKKNHRNYNIM